VPLRSIFIQSSVRLASPRATAPATWMAPLFAATAFGQGRLAGVRMGMIAGVRLQNDGWPADSVGGEQRIGHFVGSEVRG
jgi:hypothetical protein